jgi:DNA modification methylase
MWYDLDHHEKLQLWAGEVGFKVCRWPFIWCKTSPCSNQAAQYNITKSTEVCLMLRKSEHSVIKTKQSRNWIMAPSVATNSHPFVKPFDVWKYVIETVSVEGQTIVDPFAGEGSCLAAAFRLQRIPAGIEISETHLANGLSYVSSQINGSAADALESQSIISSLEGIPDAEIPL